MAEYRADATVMVRMRVHLTRKFEDRQGRSGASFEMIQPLQDSKDYERMHAILSI